MLGVVQAAMVHGPCVVTSRCTVSVARDHHGAQEAMVMSSMSHWGS